jgi:hypothetical protein
VAIFDTVPEPVAIVIGNVVPFPLVNVIVFEDTDAVIISLAINEAVDANELLIEVVAKEALNALVANDAVPSNELVIPAVTFSEPVIPYEPESCLVLVHTLPVTALPERYIHRSPCSYLEADTEDKS